MDAFTAGLLLGRVANGDPVDDVVDLYKTITSPGVQGPTPDNVQKAQAWEGKRLSDKWTPGRLGTGRGANTSEGGFYPGSRYPLLVKLDSGETFPYGFEQWELAE